MSKGKKEPHALAGIADLRGAPYNPRTMDRAALDGLRRSLHEFGDISGLVWNTRSGNLVCGHQRLAALREAHGDALKLEDGALVTPTGERYPIRLVDWDDVHERAANLAANNPLLMGDFTPEVGAVAREVGAMDGELLAGLRLDGLTGDGPGEDAGDEPRPMAVMPLPDLTWVLVGIPTVRYIEIADAVEALRKVPGVILETAIGHEGTEDSRWLSFEERGTSESGKTRRWAVLTKESGALLGFVSWFGSWRKYALYPEPKTLFERDCLRDIAAFCERRTREQGEDGKRQGGAK